MNTSTQIQAPGIVLRAGFGALLLSTVALSGHVVDAKGSNATSHSRVAATCLTRGSSLGVGIAVDPPFTYRTPDGQWQSFLPSLWRLFAKKTGVHVSFAASGWTGIVAGLQANKYNVIGASINATPERRKVINFTMPYDYSGTTFFVPKSNQHLNTIASLNKSSVTVAFVTGSDNDVTTRHFLPHASFRALPNATAADLISEVVTGRSAALATSNYLGPALVKAYPLKAVPSLVSTPRGLSPVGIAWGVRKGDSCTMQHLNTFLRRESANGDIKRLEVKYLTVKNSLK